MKILHLKIFHLKILRRIITATIVFMVLIDSDRASASLVVTNAASLGTTNLVDWQTLGEEGTSIFGPFETSVDVKKGLSVTVSDGGGFTRFDQGSGWTGDFRTGDPLIWGPGDPGELTFSFSSPVQGVGLYIQNAARGAYTANVYDAFDQLIGHEDTISTDTPGTAPFLGVLDATADISVVSFDVSGNGNGSDFAVDALNVNAGPSVPEPTPMFIFGVVAGGMMFRRRATGIFAI